MAIQTKQKKLEGVYIHASSKDFIIGELEVALNIDVYTATKLVEKHCLKETYGFTCWIRNRDITYLNSCNNPFDNIKDIFSGSMEVDILVFDTVKPNYLP